MNLSGGRLIDSIPLAGASDFILPLQYITLRLNRVGFQVADPFEPLDASWFGVLLARGVPRGCDVSERIGGGN